MRYKIPDKGLETVAETAQPGDTSEDMKVLGEMALARRFPDKAGKITFTEEKKT